MRNSEIKLTNKEFDFSTRDTYPRLKHAVIQKTTKRFDQLGSLLRANLQTEDEKTGLYIAGASSKTTRGENYQLMPYVVVDFPRISGPGFPLLFRTMFWWGNYFSLNIFFDPRKFDCVKLGDELLRSAPRKLKIYTGTNIWQQDLRDPGFINVNTLERDQLNTLLKNGDLLKLSMKVRFSKADLLEEKALKVYAKMLAMMQGV